MINKLISHVNSQKPLTKS